MRKATGSKSVADMWLWKEIFVDEARVHGFARRLMCWMCSDLNRRPTTWHNFCGGQRVSRNKGKGEEVQEGMLFPADKDAKMVLEGPKKCEKMICGLGAVG